MTTSARRLSAQSFSVSRGQPRLFCWPAGPVRIPSIHRPFAFMVEPVSVTSTMASQRPSTTLASVAPLGGAEIKNVRHGNPLSVSRFFVDLVRVEQRVRVLHPFPVFPSDIKTAAVAGVAGGQAVLLHLDDDRVGVTVGQYFHDLLGVAGLLTLHPVLVASAAEKPGLAVLQSQIKGLFIHEGYHKNFTVLVVLDNRRDQPPHFVEIDLNHAVPPQYG